MGWEGAKTEGIVVAAGAETMVVEVAVARRGRDDEQQKATCGEGV
jgi:hypothetical protein